jgi:hypothetical protein
MGEILPTKYVGLCLRFSFAHLSTPSQSIFFILTWMAVFATFPTSIEQFSSSNMQEAKMRRYQGWIIVAAFSLAAWGCNKTEQPTQEQNVAANQASDPTQNSRTIPNTKTVNKPAVKADTPEATTQIFLEALRTGNDEQASAMISALARQRTAALTGRITPSASDTAKFSLGKVDFVGEDGARVASTWTDVDEDGQPHSNEAVWVLRKEAEGWRIVGVAAVIIPGEEPLVLNFENPDEMRRKQQELRERLNGASEEKEPENREAQQKDRPDDSLRR